MGAFRRRPSLAKQRSYVAHAVSTVTAERPPPEWAGQRVKISQIVAVIDDLRKEKLKASTRTSVATLIVVTRSDDEVDAANTVIEHLGARHPARIITLEVPEKAASGFDR